MAIPTPWPEHTAGTLVYSLNGFQGESVLLGGMPPKTIERHACFAWPGAKPNPLHPEGSNDVLSFFPDTRSLDTIQAMAQAWAKIPAHERQERFGRALSPAIEAAWETAKRLSLAAADHDQASPNIKHA